MRCLAAVIAMALLLLPAVGCKPVTPKGDEHQTLSTAGETWCPEGFESGPNDTCFALPDKGDKDTPVVVYLHGMYSGHGLPSEWRAVRGAVDHGFAVVVPRGKRGLCAWRSELKDYYCWPQDPEDTSSMKSVVAEWSRVLWQVDALLEGGVHKRYVLGSSNGGFFAEYLATHGVFPGRAYAVVNGGALGHPEKRSPLPMLLIRADDAKEAANPMTELHDVLSKSGWPHAFCRRSGGPELTTEDVDSALRFFRQDAAGLLKVRAGAYACDAGSATP